MAEGNSPYDDLIDSDCDEFITTYINDPVTGVQPYPEIATATLVTRAPPCRFFLQGRCMFGDECWNSHITPSKENILSRHLERFDIMHNPGPSRPPAIQERPVEKSKQFQEVAAEKPPPLSVEMPKAPVTKNDKYEPKFSTLTKSIETPQPRNWAEAPEFVPKPPRSYADTVKSTFTPEQECAPYVDICAYFIDGECPFLNVGAECPYIHGELCDMCQKPCLHPSDENQRKFHIDMCEKELEQDMELSFAIQRSRDKSCGICMDTIMEKLPICERRFGILEKCNHVFCLTCIRRWRAVRSLEGNGVNLDSGLDPTVTRGCPECRTPSDFITPSQYWVDTQEEKGKLIADYKVALSKKPCKYFRQGKGNCPFGGACFYLHAKPDGTKVELPPPTRRRRQNTDGALDFVGRIFLWDYLEFRDDNLMQLEMDELEALHGLHYSDISSISSDDGSDSQFIIGEPF